MRELILSLLTPGKIKIYLIILIILIIYTIYYRYVLNTNSPTVEAFHNKNLKANPQKMNDSDNDKEKIVDTEIITDNYGIDTLTGIKNNIDIYKFEQKLMENKPRDRIERFVDVSMKKPTTKDELLYKEELKKTRKELALAEDAKLRAYNTAFNNYLEAQRKNKLNLNVVDIGNSIEGGIIDIFQSISGIKDSDSDPDSASAPKSAPKSAIITDTPIALPEKIDVIEGFISSDNSNSNRKNKSKQKITRKEKFADSNSSSESYDNIISYSLDTISNLLVYLKNYHEIFDIITKEDNMIPAGVLMIIISMALYFIDITS
jgi:hypothetical protein